MTRASRVAGVVLALLAMQPVLAAPAPVPPPPDQPVVDCARPVYAIDTMICDDRDLGAATAEVDGLLAGLSFAALDPGWIEPQADWVRRRALCAFQPDGHACVADAFAERLAILRALRGAGGGVRVVAVAPGMSSWRPFVAIERDTGRQLVMKAKAARISCKIAAAVR